MYILRKKQCQILNSLISSHLFVWGLWIFFHSCGDLTIIGEGLQNFTFTLQKRPLSSGGSLVKPTVTRVIRL